MVNVWGYMLVRAFFLEASSNDFFIVSGEL